MTKHWKRRLEIDVAGTHLDLNDLQAQFQVRQAVTPNPDWAYVRIINLSRATSESIWQKDVPIQINAGYHEGPFGLIFDGTVNDMRRSKLNGTDRYHDILATSGRKSYTHAFVSETLPKDSTLEDATRLALREMLKLDLKGEGYIDPALKSITITKPWTIQRKAKELLDKIGESANATWYIFNGQFYFVSNSGSVPGSNPRIAADTGLIGLPEVQLEGIVVRVLMNAHYKLKQMVTIDAEVEEQLSPRVTAPGDISGTRKRPTAAAGKQYWIVRIDHDGETRANQPWYTTLTCVSTQQAERGDALSSPGNKGVPRGVPEKQDQGGGAGGGGGGG